MQGLVTKVKITLEMIKWEHSIFALPFALTATLLAAHGLPGWRTLLWILVAMVSARSSAMAFNRWADADIDATNPRTKMRAIPAGLLSRQFVFVFTLFTAALFLFATAQLNRLTFLLSPGALVVLLGYSYLKRFTRWAHLGLGLALGLAPAGAWIAVRGSLDPRILVLSAVVLLWVADFDVLYACQDFDHDRAEGLYSLPSRIGIERSFHVARIMHLLMIALLILLSRLFHFHVWGELGVVVVAGLIAYEHMIISPKDLRRLNAAFFTMNGVISMVFLAFVAAEVWL